MEYQTRLGNTRTNRYEKGPPLLVEISAWRACASDLAKTVISQRSASRRATSYVQIPIELRSAGSRLSKGWLTMATFTKNLSGRPAAVGAWECAAPTSRRAGSPSLVHRRAETHD